MVTVTHMSNIAQFLAIQKLKSKLKQIKILGGHFEITGIFMAFIVAVFISFINILMQKCIIEPIIRKER